MSVYTNKCLKQKILSKYCLLVGAVLTSVTVLAGIKHHQTHFREALKLKEVSLQDKELLPRQLQLSLTNEISNYNKFGLKL